MLGSRPVLRSRSPRALPETIVPQGFQAVIAACADSQPPVQRALFATIASENPDAVLFAGDASYAGRSDRRRRASLAAWRVDWHASADRVYAVPGNHDLDSRHARRTWRRAMPGVEGTPESLDGLAFRLRVGPVLVIALTAPGDHRIPAAQLAFAAEALADDDAPHRIAVFHEPAWPAGLRVGQSLDRHPAERDRLWAVLEDGGVGVVVNGHDHAYARRTIDIRRPVVQVTTGGAGAPLYADTHGGAEVFVPTFHYVVMRADPWTIRLRALALDGRVLDEVEVPARADVHAQEGAEP